MLHISNIPLEVYHRALDLFGQSREATLAAAQESLSSAESRLDTRPEFPGITPFAQAIAEYMSLAGPFAPGEEFEAINGYRISR